MEDGSAEPGAELVLVGVRRLVSLRIVRETWRSSRVKIRRSTRIERTGRVRSGGVREAKCCMRLSVDRLARVPWNASQTASWCACLSRSQS